MKPLDEMTNEEINGLEPGPEVDWLVAQHMPADNEEGYAPVFDFEAHGEPMLMTVYKMALGRPCGDFCPSGDANAAVAVLKILGDVRIEHYACNSQWCVIHFGDAWDKSFCMAVCKAFLRERRR